MSDEKKTWPFIRSWQLAGLAGVRPTDKRSARVVLNEAGRKRIEKRRRAAGTVLRREWVVTKYGLFTTCAGAQGGGQGKDREHSAPARPYETCARMRLIRRGVV